MSHVVLLGDSIFDNAAYVDNGPAVIEQLRTRLPSPWQASLLAIDGSATADVAHQLGRLPHSATHVVISSGGNDALGGLGVLHQPVHSVLDALGCLSDLQNAFEANYRDLLTLARQTGKKLAVCTIYDAVPGIQAPILKALSLFNDVITRQAVLHQLPIVDLRVLCHENADYSPISPIEPSIQGGDKIASAIAKVLTSHDFGSQGCVLYG